MKAFVVTAFSLSGLLLLAWPFLVFSLAFVDQPPRHPLGGFTVAFQVYSTLAYPVVWAIALFCVIRAMRSGGKQPMIVSASVAPLVLMVATIAGRSLW